MTDDRLKKAAKSSTPDTVIHKHHSSVKVTQLSLVIPV